MINKKILKRNKRRLAIRAKIVSSKTRAPRLSTFRSNKYIYGQLIDDVKGHTLASVSDREIEDKKRTKLEKAKLAGELLAEKALKVGIKKVIFDRGGYKYHGRVRALAEGAREKGLEF